MKALLDVPIRKKVLIVVMTTCLSALGIAALGIGIYESRSSRAMIKRELETLAKVVSMNSAAAVVFQDNKSAEETITALSAVPHIIGAGLYLPNGSLFAYYQPAGSASTLNRQPARAEGTYFDMESGSLILFQDIHLGGERVGSIGLQSDMRELYSRLRRYAMMIAVLMISAAVIALVMTGQLQKLITGPMLGLAMVAREVSEQRDYSRRATKEGEDETGRLVDCFNEMLDEIQRRDNELQKAHDELEDRVIQRTTELEQEIHVRKSAEEQLARMVRRLEEANQELNDFAYIVSHDLKAPLRAIGSLAEWLSMDYGDRLDDDGRAKLGMLLGRTKRMADLINAILQYSRLGRAGEHPMNVDLNVLVPEVIDLLGPPPNITVRLDNLLPTVYCDRTRLIQLFQNLISNAIKYMDKPLGMVSVSCSDEGEEWRFTVRDNGPGIDSKYFERIFQIFETLAPRDKVESTGVGLALVKKIVGMAGGRVWVESEVGVGSAFMFTFPKITVGGPATEPT